MTGDRRKRSAQVGLVLLLAALLPGAGATSQAQDSKLTLRGTVERSEGTRLRGQRARVTLRGAHHPFHAQVWTDLGGRFKFTDLQPGVYVLLAELQGMASERVSIDVSRQLADTKGRMEQVVTLQPDPTGSSSRVSVTELAISKGARKQFEKADRLLGKGRVSEAVALLQKAVAEAPSFVRAINTLGTIAYHQKNFAAAENYFRQALSHDSDAYAPLVNLGGALISQERYAEAFEINQTAVHRQPEDPLANSQMGLNYWGLRRSEPAIRFLRRAKELDPGHFSYPQLTLAQIFLDLGDLPKARAELEEFLQLHPDAKEASPIREFLQRTASP